MSLVTRLQDLVNGRIQIVVPEIAQTVWDTSKVTTFIEQLTPQSSDGVRALIDLDTGEKLDGDWHRVTTFTGAAITRLRSANKVNLDPLWVDLIEETIFINPDLKTAEGELSCRCRATFQTVRQNWDDQGLITTLSFNLKGSWLRRLARAPDFKVPAINEDLEEPPHDL